MYFKRLYSLSWLTLKLFRRVSVDDDAPSLHDVSDEEFLAAELINQMLPAVIKQHECSFLVKFNRIHLDDD